MVYIIHCSIFSHKRCPTSDVLREFSSVISSFLTAMADLGSIGSIAQGEEKFKEAPAFRDRSPWGRLFRTGGAGLSYA